MSKLDDLNRSEPPTPAPEKKERKRLFDRIPKARKTLKEGQKVEVAKPAVELKGGKLVWHREPDRPLHVCVDCKFFHEPVRLQESFRPTGRMHVTYEGTCLLNTAYDLGSETVLKCNAHQKGRPGSASQPQGGPSGVGVGAITIACAAGGAIGTLVAVLYFLV